MSKLRHSLCAGNIAVLLRHGDRNSMRWSIESRVPFLTTEIAEFIFSLPEEYLISKNGETKHIFREAMRGIVPNEILDRQDKIGFATPERNFLNELISKNPNWIKYLEEVKFINNDLLKEEVEKSLKEKKSINSQVWRLFNLSYLLSNKQFQNYKT